MKIEKAIFTAGRFLGAEEAFRNIPVVAKNTAGYIGGTKDNPTHEEVAAENSRELKKGFIKPCKA